MPLVGTAQRLSINIRISNWTLRQTLLQLPGKLRLNLHLLCYFPACFRFQDQLTQLSFVLFVFCVGIFVAVLEAVGKLVAAKLAIVSKLSRHCFEFLFIENLVLATRSQIRKAQHVI